MCILRHGRRTIKPEQGAPCSPIKLTLSACSYVLLSGLPLRNYSAEVRMIADTRRAREQGMADFKARW
jgi:hypothetical protein